jgi:hypothetical protein
VSPDEIEDIIAEALMAALEQGDWPWEDHCRGVAAFVYRAMLRAGVRDLAPIEDDGTGF